MEGFEGAVASSLEHNIHYMKWGKHRLKLGIF